MHSSLTARYSLFVFLFFIGKTDVLLAQGSAAYLQQGWNELIKDNDSSALKLFHDAYEISLKEKNHEQQAKALLYLGIGSYGASYSNGLQFALKALDEYKKLETDQPAKANEGRSRCLQLISTINSRQGKFKEAISLSREALNGLIGINDTTGTRCLIYNSIGTAYEQEHNKDSAVYYFKLGLNEALHSGHTEYLPNAYCKMAAIELVQSNKSESLTNYLRALAIADSLHNRQAQVTCLLGLAQWHLHEHHTTEAEQFICKAKQLAQTITDKSFYLNALVNLASLKKGEGNFQEALSLQETINHVNDTLNTWEKQRLVKSLEVQFNMLEKDRKIKLIQDEKELSQRANLFLTIILALTALLAVAIVWFMRRINQRNKLLLQTQQELARSAEVQKQLKEQQLQNEIEFKESQLSALTLQMLQKSELLLELKEKYDDESQSNKVSGIDKIITKAMNQEKDWVDFNLHFESMNKNFYSRLKQNYPDISPNDLKICALIKLNLSIKEMAGILNISPDSVKTARYRLRKKLGMNTEDNLTNFILTL